MSRGPSVKHGEGTYEFALCGLAFDAFDSGDVDEPVVFAEPGQLVTCTQCQDVMDNVRRNFKGYRVTKAKEPK